MLLDSASQWRFELAQSIVPHLAADPMVSAIMLAGSTARNCADAYSDVELGVFWKQPPTENQLNAYIARAGGRLWKREPYPEHHDLAEEWGYAQLKMDLHHITEAGMDAILRDVTETFNPSLYKQVTLSALQHSRPLYNAPLITAWQARLTPYPNGLRDAMLRQYLHFTQLWFLENMARREEWPLLYEDVTTTTQAVLRLLVGLNRLYYPGLKWLKRLIGELTIAPPNLAQRVQTIFRAEPLTAVNELGKLVVDVCNLVEHHAPGLGAQQAQEIFLKRRQPYETRPSV